MIEARLYKYDSTKSAYRGTNYSQYILSGVQYTDDLTEVLDTCEITLVGLSFSEEFDPTTKFILELWDTEINQMYDSYSLCVASDVVTQPILSDDHYFNHAITFNEASVIAQGRIVDNCSETFELKDVNLNAESTYNPNENAERILNNVGDSDLVANYESGGTTSPWEKISYKRKFEWVFTEEYLPSTDPNYGRASDWENAKKYIPVAGGETLKLPIPLLATYFGLKGEAGYESNMNLCSVTIEVYESADGTNWTLNTNLSKDINPSAAILREYNWVADWRFQERYGHNLKGYGMNRSNAITGALNEYYKKFAEYDPTIADRFVEIPLTANMQYCVIVKPKFFTTAINELGDHHIDHEPYVDNFYGDSENMYYPYSFSYIHAQLSFTLGYTYSVQNNSQQIILPSVTENNGMPMLKLNFSTYIAGSNASILFKSAPALSAYDLFIDAQLKSQTTEKQEGIYIKDTPLPYYCLGKDINILQNTEIIESSFNQKNFWEILLEIGKYIHAIPYIEFGSNDRFIVKWRYLGQTEKATDNSTKMSIFNSRSVENYVGALNSYVTNMIQRGAQIEEYVAPKSESEDYLVYNDVAVIKTTKPIIEILSLKFRCVTSNGSYYTASTNEYDITNNIYEHNVYELLDVTASTRPNKGEAIYYNLGENIVRGLNYQLPSVNVGDGDTEYAIKRIIGQTIMQNSKTDWQFIRVNDFIFKITYRTKETVRSEQSRPDLRKYLINSYAYEKIPHHKQFNNQQDVSVDSIKLGNQVYGKLIKTGNTEIRETEWNTNIFDLKIAGQLVDIRGNIYYVSKATHTFAQDYIVSEITYSKDYNQLSEIIGIPSEPRFFEISEQSQIDRHISINKFAYLSTQNLESTDYDKYHLKNIRLGFIPNLLCSSQVYPKYAISQIKNDLDNKSAELGLSSFSIDLIHPISSYSMRNTLSFKWEMVDNFSAGDRVEVPNNYPNPQPSTNEAYGKLLPTQYTDIYGRADLLDFIIINDLPSSSITKDKIRTFPLSPYRLQMVKVYGDDYGNGSALTGLSYRTTGNDPWVSITANTTSFEINYGPSALGSWGDIVDSNNNSILPLSNLYDGDYYIINDNGTYCVFVCDDLSGGLFKFTRIYSTNNFADVTRILNTPSAINIDSRIIIDSGFNDVTFGTGEHGLALVKDNRERILFNYNLQILTDSDRFVLSGYMWQQNKGTIKLALLNTEVNKIINNTIPSDTIITKIPIQYTLNKININDMLSGVTDSDLAEVKALAIIDEKTLKVGAGIENYFIVARNIDGLVTPIINVNNQIIGYHTTEARKDWGFFEAAKDLFKHQ